MLRIINERKKNPESNGQMSHNQTYHAPASPPQRYWVLCYECPLCNALLVYPEHGHRCPCKSKEEDQKIRRWEFNPPTPPPQQAQSSHHRFSQKKHQNTQQPQTQQQRLSPRPSQNPRQLRKQEVPQRPNWDDYRPSKALSFDPHALPAGAELEFESAEGDTFFF